MIVFNQHSFINVIFVKILTCYKIVKNVINVDVVMIVILAIIVMIVSIVKIKKINNIWLIINNIQKKNMIKYSKIQKNI